MRIFLLALLLTACAPPNADQVERDQRPSGPSVSIGGGMGTYVGAGSR